MELADIQQAGVAVARNVGYRNVTRAKVCTLLGITPAQLQYRCAFKDLAAYLEAQAPALGLVPGVNCDGNSTAKFSGMWADHNKAKTLEVAYRLASERGFKGFNRSDVASGAGVSAGVINLRWGSMPQLLDEVVREAERQTNMDVLRQAQAVGNPIAVAYFNP